MLNPAYLLHKDEVIFYLNQHEIIYLKFPNKLVYD